MGAGASFESGLGLEEEQYFCHACRRVFTLGGPRHDMTCPHCDSTFLEEVGGVRQSELLPGRRGGRPYQNIFGDAGGSLSAEQTRRISSAATMLRLLETQLRQELEQLQFAFENNHVRIGDGSRNDQGGAQPTKPKLSKIMLGKCLECVLDVDTVCSQPSCPICSEDFTVSSEETKLPCGHLFHRPCVLPWLQQKQNCPICRSQLSDEIPSLPELEKLPLKHLSSWLALMQQQGESVVTSIATAAEHSQQKEVEEGDTDNTNHHSESKPEDITTECRVENNTRTALAKKLSQALLQYQEDLEETQRQEQQRQVSAATAQRARLQNLDEHITEYLTHNQWRGNAAPLRTESMPTMLTRTASNESNQTISAALRRGFHSHTAGPTSATLNNSFSISGSTPLRNGRQLHHSIRLVDEDSDNEADDSDENSTPTDMEGAYHRAQQQHLARFGVGGIDTTASSMAHPFSSSLSVGSTGLLSTAATRPQRPYDPSEDAMRAFVWALHPERAEDDLPREPARSEGRSGAASPSAGGHARVRFADQDEDDAPHSATAAAEQHMVDTTVSGDGNSSSSSAGERMGHINQRVSAIDRYMTLSAPQLFGTSSTVHSPNPSSSTGTSQQPLGATFQVRASGAGSYTTVAVTAATPDTAVVAAVD